VEGLLKEEFLAFLDEQGLAAWPTMKIPDLLAAQCSAVVEIKPDRDQSKVRLEHLVGQFLKERGDRSRPASQGN